MCSNVWKTRNRRVPLTLLVLIWFTPLSRALSLVDFFPFNSTYGDKKTESSDDGGSGEIQLNISFPFFNRSHDKLYVNNNGVISFLKELKTYRPGDFPLQDDTAIIAPFWADVDIKTVGGTVWYRESRNKDLLSLATAEIRNYFPPLRKFKATWVFIATWDNVGFYGASEGGKNKRNTFQAVLITDSLQSFVIFNYNKIDWTTGSNSGGDTSTGTGGNPAQAGFNAGDKKTYKEIPGARNDSVINLTLTSNVGIPGKWVFKVDAAVISGSCSKGGNGVVFVWPKSGSMLGAEIIRISGPCFYQGDKLLARFDEVNMTFPCTMVDGTIAKCLTPTVFRTGRLTLSLNIDNSGWNYTGSFTISNIALVRPLVRRHNPENWVFDSRSVKISWNAEDIPSNFTNVELLAYKVVSGYPTLERVLDCTNVPNNGQTDISKLPYIPSVSLAVIKVGPCQGDWNSSTPAIWSDVFPVRWSRKSRSEKWCKAWLEKEAKQSKLKQPEPCPCTLRQAEGDTGRYQPDPFCNQVSNSKDDLNCLYRGKAWDCIMPNFQGSTAPSQTCCYGRDDELLHARENTGGGTVGRYHFRSQGDSIVPFFTYFEDDVLPYLHCCRLSNNYTQCREFLKFRPPATCQGYTPPAAAQAAGDPHLVTLDGKQYTFNGEGEFVLVQDDEDRVVVQVRAERAQDIEGKLQNATIFTAVAMTITNVSDVLEIRMNQEDIVEIVVNGERADLVNGDKRDDATTSTSELKGLTIYRNDTGNSTTEVTVVMESVGLSVLVQATKDLLNILMIVGSSQLRGKLTGLLGNYNGDVSDDLLPRNGTLLSSNASMREIHYDFGMTWAVRPENSLFTRDSERLPQDDVSGKRLVPYFIDGADKDNLRNGTNELCGDNAECIFDFTVTGNVEIAKSTKAFVKRFEERKKEIEAVVRCPYLDQLVNGNRTITGYTEGSVTIFVCDKGYVFPPGDQGRLECREDGTWSGHAPQCTKHEVPNRGLTKTHIIAISAGSGGVMFLLIVIIVLVCKCKPERNKKKKSDEGSEHEVIDLPSIFPPSHIPGPVFENPSFLQNLNKLGDSGTFKIPRPTYVDPSIYSEYF